MKLQVLAFLFAVHAAFGAGWEAVQRIAPGTKTEVRMRESPGVRGVFVSADQAAIVIRGRSGERSIARDEVRRVLVADPSRRIRNGLIATAVGAGVGLAIGAAICPYCANEGAGGKYTGPMAGIGAGIGAAGGFLPLPYRTVYRSR